MTENQLTDAEVDELRQLSERAPPAPWRAMIEGRDHTSGDSFIMIGPEDGRDEDMYVARDARPAPPQDPGRWPPRRLATNFARRTPAA